MRKPTIDAEAEGPVATSTERRLASRPGELVAKAVVLIGGASLMLGGVIGYALGYLERGRDREDRHEA